MPKKKVSKKKVTRKRVAKKVAPKHPSFVFVGNGLDDPETCGYGAYTFTLNGPAVTIPDPVVAAKLSNNSHFKAK